MESVQPAPNGTRYEGYDGSFSSWETLIDDTTSHFEVEDVHTGDERALIRWRYVCGRRLLEDRADSRRPGELTDDHRQRQ